MDRYPDPKKEGALTVEPRCEIFNEDCIAGMERRLADGSVHLTVTSIPFE